MLPVTNEQMDEGEDEEEVQRGVRDFLVIGKSLQQAILPLKCYTGSRT